MKIIASLVARLKTGHSDHRAIAGGMTWVALFVLLASLARAAREMAIAYRYGVGPEVDAYLFTFSLVNWPAGVWFSVVTVVLLPLAARIQRKEPEQLPQFRSELLGMALLLGLCLTTLAALGFPLLLNSTWTGLSADSLLYARSMSTPLAFLTLLGILIGLLSVWTMAGGRHTNTLLEGTPALVLLVVVLALPGVGVEALIWGTLAGSAFHLVALVVPLGNRHEVEWPRLGYRSPHWPAFWQGFSIMLAGQALMSLTTVADQFFAAHLDVGAIATLGYANRILALILGLGALAVTRGTLPVFSRAQAQDPRHASLMARQWALALLGLGVVGAIIGRWLAPWLVSVLFERGAFTASNTQSVAEVFCYGLAQLPFYFSGLVFTSYFSSRGLYVWLLWSGVIGLSAKLLGNLLLMPLYGVAGLALATALTYAANFVFFWIVFGKVSKTA